ncbi:hypothetical protein TWF679_005874 [Orbilia oligospora]|uniref:F-box domain-containing protein n=1 Tax=Orbilia oligospora TaxID=2813651 RepID=A0A8H8VLK1_ORBOL|nr:hypothetical protein TWF679_005874 [Orbilia oligospora]
MQRRTASKNGGPRDPFRFFPAELNILIIKFLRNKDLHNLSRCSKLCYLLCFPRRFDKSAITLTNGSIGLFQDGGLCEQYRTAIRSIQFGKTIAGKVLRPLGTDQEIAEVITQLRIWTDALNIFPRVQELYVSYKILPVLENNVYTAVMSAIAAQPFYKDLQCLEFQVSKDTETGDPRRYEDIFRSLLPEDRDFLGQKISKNEVDALIRAKLPELSSLTTARISVDGICTPLISSKTTFWEGSTFYYVPLTRAPNLEDLWVETLTVSSKPRSNDPKPNSLKNYKERLYSDPGHPHHFTSLIKLHYTADGIPSKNEIDALPETFPNLEVLEISQLELSRREDGSDTSLEDDRDGMHRYDGIGKLKHLVDVTMPWPAYEDAGPLSPGYLSGWIYRWIRDEARNLDVVAFEGTRYVVGRRDEIRVICRVGAAEVEVDLRGDTTVSRYEDIVPENYY